MDAQAEKGVQRVSNRRLAKGGNQEVVKGGEGGESVQELPVIVKGRVTIYGTLSSDHSFFFFAKEYIND